MALAVGINVGPLHLARLPRAPGGGLIGIICYLVTLSLMMCVWMLQVAWWSIVATFWLCKMLIVWAAATVPATFATIRQNRQP